MPRRRSGWQRKGSPAMDAFELPDPVRQVFLDRVLPGLKPFLVQIALCLDCVLMLSKFMRDAHRYALEGTNTVTQEIHKGRAGHASIRVGCQRIFQSFENRKVGHGTVDVVAAAQTSTSPSNTVTAGPLR